MFCKRCFDIKPTCNKKLNLLPLKIEGDIWRINCNDCKTFITVTANNEIINIDETLNRYIKNGWKKVETNKEKVIYYILNQIIYPELDIPKKEMFESMYKFADDDDDIFIRWINGKPIGFYTVKQKDVEKFSTLQNYFINIVDTIYIRSEYRKQGFGLELLYDVIQRYPGDLGFSTPISKGMLQVFRKFLIQHKEYRLKFWEVENGGSEGYSKLIWFLLRKMDQN